jgi:hypothetical protein
MLFLRLLDRRCGIISSDFNCNKQFKSRCRNLRNRRRIGSFSRLFHSIPDADPIAISGILFMSHSTRSPKRSELSNRILLYQVRNFRASSLPKRDRHFQADCTRHPKAHPFLLHNSAGAPEAGTSNPVNWASDVIVSAESRFGLFEDSR